MTGLSVIGLGLVALIGAYLVGNMDWGVVWQDETYKVAWIDFRDLMQVWRKLKDDGAIGRIGPEVVAVASDKNCLTARLHPNFRTVGNALEEFYYIDKVRDTDLLDGRQIAVGPIDKAAFEAAVAKLHLPRPVDF